MTAPDRDEACPHCGLTYGRLRTDLDYQAVYSMLWVESPDSALWRYKRRHTVLGFWMSIKRDMWASHLEQCRYLSETVAQVEDIESYTPDDFIPW